MHDICALNAYAIWSLSRFSPASTHINHMGFDLIKYTHICYVTIGIMDLSDDSIWNSVRPDLIFHLAIIAALL